MNGALFCIALLVGGLAWLALYGANHRAKAEKKHAWERVGAGLASIATFGGLLSLIGVLGQVFRDAGEGVGLFILVVVLGVAGVFGGPAIVRGWQHHRHSTLALGVILGGGVAIAVGAWQEIRLNAGQALASAGHGITSAVGSKPGTATAHGHASSSGGGVLGLVLIIAAAVILGAIVVAKHRKKQVRDVPRARALPAGSGS